MRHLLIAMAALVLPTAAFAQQAATTTIATPAAAAPPSNTLLPGGLDLPIVEGSSVPADCHFPDGLRNAAHYDLACVVMPRDSQGDHIGAQYLGMLGQRGWHQGDLITGGFSAVHLEANGCERVLGIYPSEYPPSADNTAAQAAPQRDPEEFGGEDDEDGADNGGGDTVLWFALDRQQRCNAAHAQ
jgi:hypothetical protein